MADEGERARSRALGGGDVHDLALHLRDRLRAGELTKRTLGCAAALGYEPARIALGLEEAPREDWPGILHALPLSGAVRAALVALQAEDPAACGSGWEVAAAWAREPSPARHADARAELHHGGARPAELALLTGVVHSDKGRLRQLIEAADAQVPDLRARVRAALVPWLLGEDPL